MWSKGIETKALTFLDLNIWNLNEARAQLDILYGWIEPVHSGRLANYDSICCMPPSNRQVRHKPFLKVGLGAGL